MESDSKATPADKPVWRLQEGINGVFRGRPRASTSMDDDALVILFFCPNPQDRYRMDLQPDARGQERDNATHRNDPSSYLS